MARSTVTVAPVRIPVATFTAPIGTSNPLAVTGRSVVAPNILMKGPAQLQQHFSDRRLNAIQRGAFQASQAANASYAAGAKTIRGVSFIGGAANQLEHGLGRAWVGYRLETFIGANSSYHCPASGIGSKGDAQFISVTCGTTTTADVVVW